MLACDRKISFNRGMAKRDDGEWTTIGVKVSTRDLLADYCTERHGSNVRDVTTALIEWFLRQDKPVRTAILSGVDDGMEPHYAAMLRALATDLETPETL